MKSIVCNVFALTVVVSCLALVLNRPLQADEKKVTEQKKIVVAVKVEGDVTGASDAVKKALEIKLDGLPDELKKRIQETIKKQLESAKFSDKPTKTEVRVERIISAKEAEEAKKKKANVWIGKPDEAQVKARAIIVGSDGAKLEWIPSLVEKAGGKKAHAIHIVSGHQCEGDCKVLKDGNITCNVCQDGKSKAIRIAVAADEKSLGDSLKNLTVTIDNGKVLLNGKPISVQLPKHPPKASEKEIELHVEKVDTGDKKTTRRIMVIMNKDGNVQKLDIDEDVDVVVDKVAHPKVMQLKAEAYKKAKATQKKVQEAHEKSQEAQKKIQDALKRAGVHVHVDAQKITQEAQKDFQQALKSFDVRLRAQGNAKAQEALKKAQEAQMKAQAAMKQAHAHDHTPKADGSKANADVAKRLQRIETELKKIRQLLEQMKNN